MWSWRCGGMRESLGRLWREVLFSVSNDLAKIQSFHHGANFTSSFRVKQQTSKANPDATPLTPSSSHSPNGRREAQDHHLHHLVQPLQEEGQEQEVVFGEHNAQVKAGLRSQPFVQQRGKLKSKDSNKCRADWRGPALARSCTAAECSGNAAGI